MPRQREEEEEEECARVTSVAGGPLLVTRRTGPPGEPSLGVSGLPLPRQREFGRSVSASVLQVWAPRKLFRIKKSFAKAPNYLFAIFL
jgi:hypothetical protein